VFKFPLTLIKDLISITSYQLIYSCGGLEVKVQ